MTHGSAGVDGMHKVRSIIVEIADRYPDCGGGRVVETRGRAALLRLVAGRVGAAVNRGDADLVKVTLFSVQDLRREDPTSAVNLKRQGNWRQG